MVIAMVNADPEGLKKAMVSDAPSPIDYGEINKPEEVLAEDKEIESYPLGVEADKVTIVPVDEMFDR